jgi:hypothetical protein
MAENFWDKYEELWGGDDFDAKEKFVRLYNLPNDLVLDILSSEGDLEILCALGSNINLSPEIAWNMFNYEYALTADEDSEGMIHRGLATNKSAPADLLHALANSENEEIAEIAQETLDNLN